MDILRRWYEGGRRNFKIYSQEEADKLGIKYVYWRDAKKGDWVLSDDGFVGECLKIYGPYGKTKSRQFMFSFAYAWENSKSKLNYLERKAARSYWTSGTKHWAEKEVGKSRSKRFILAYVMMYFAGNIDWEKLGLIYRSDRHSEPTRRAKHLFKQEAFQKMIKQKMIDVFKEKGKTEGDVLEMFDKAFEMAKNNKDPKEMRLVAEVYRDLFEMLPEKQVVDKFLPGEEVDWDEIEEQSETRQIES